MRCGAVITYKERRSQAGTRMAISPNATMTWYGTSDVGVFPSQQTFADLLSKPNTEVCDGNVVADVVAEEEPYMGGVSAALSITYKCDKCGNQFFPELPQNADELSALLTSQIALIDEVPLRAHKREAILRERAQQEEWRREALADLKVREAERREKKSQKAAERLARGKPAS